MHRVALACALLAPVFFSGCGSLPEVGPFAEASAQLRSGVASSGDAVVAEVRRIEGGAKLSDKLAAEWAARVKMCEALVRYADSLQAITKAGGEGRQAVQSIADSATALAKAAGIVLPAAGTVAVAVDAAKFIYAQIALARAANALEDSLETVAPAVEEVAVHIARDLKSLEKILDTAAGTSRNALRTRHSGMLGFRGRVDELRSAAYSKVGNAPPATLTRELDEINKLMDATRPLNEAYEKELLDMEKRRNAASALIRASSDAIGQWGVAHRQLVVAVKTRSPVNAQSLIDASKEIRDLVKRMREL
jgi:hypothetical protein